MKYILTIFLLYIVLTYGQTQFIVNSALDYDGDNILLTFNPSGFPTSKLVSIKLVDSVNGGSKLITNFNKVGTTQVSIASTPDMILSGTIAFCAQSPDAQCSGNMKWNPHVVNNITIYYNNTVVVVGKYLKNTTNDNDLTINNIALDFVSGDSITNSFVDPTNAISAIQSPYKADYVIRLDTFSYTSNIFKQIEIIKATNTDKIVTITCYNLAADTKVTCDGKPVTITVDKDVISIDITANNINLGKRVFVVTSGTATKTFNLTIDIPMTISKSTIPSVSGGVLTLTGDNYPAGETVKVSVGDFPCDVQTITKTEITCKLDKIVSDDKMLSKCPVSITFQDKTVTSNFTVDFSDVPTISDISSAPVTGGAVTIKGTNFKTPFITSLGGIPCITINSTAVVLICNATAGSGSKRAVGFNTGGFNCTAIPKTFSYLPPSVRNVTQNMTDVGGKLNVYGNNFVKKGLSIIINSNYTCPNSTFWNDTCVSCIVEGGYLKKLARYNSTLNVTVTADGQTGSAKVFSYSQFINETAEPTKAPSTGSIVSFNNILCLSILLFTVFLI